MKKILWVYFLLTLLTNNSYSTPSDTTITKKEKIKKGWNLGAIPALAYDTDIGFLYGGIVNFFHYGDGTIYPEYKHSIYLEWSTTTKGSGTSQFLYDSKYLIPNIRTSAELSYLTEQALDFYGFNGYQSYYNSNYEDDSPGNPDYISRVFYRHERNLLHARVDLNGRLYIKNLHWIGGFSHFNIKIDTVDINRLNDGKSESEKLPNTQGGLYGDYIRWGIIPEDQTHGGYTNLLRLGLEFDTRDNEPNPMKGIWSEVLLLMAPGFLNDDCSFGKIALTHRQYFTILPKKLSLVYRIGYQAKIYGDIPYYMLPFVFNSGRSLTRDGLGGGKTIRGILRNRIVGDDFIYSNIETRWIFFRNYLFKQNFYTALNLFADFGMVTSKYQYSFDPDIDPNEYAEFFPDTKETLHTSIGAGLHFALNQNFIVSVNYGIALDKRDGKNGLYIGLNWLF